MEKLNEEELGKFRNEIDIVCQKYGRDLYIMIFSSKENVFNDKDRDEDIIDSFQVTGFKDPAFCGHTIRKILFTELVQSFTEKNIEIDANHLHMFSSMILEELEYYNRVLYKNYRKDAESKK